jgi:5-methylcytosine-specific restriction endonuclease McrA
MPAKRDYTKERLAESSERKAARAQRNRARRKVGLKNGDPRHVDHKTPISKGGGNGSANLRAVTAKTNLTKGSKAAKKPKR